ncbi:MAG: hypothetical protein RJQ08_08615 [Salinisphaeraceae bacterium]
MSQYDIRGDGNVVGDNNEVTYVAAGRPPADHPNAMRCPQCHEPTWRASDFCVGCGFNLAARRIAEKQNQERRMQVVASGYTLIAIGILFLFFFDNSLFAWTDYAFGAAIAIGAGLIWLSGRLP